MPGPEYGGVILGNEPPVDEDAIEPETTVEGEFETTVCM